MSSIRSSSVHAESPRPAPPPGHPTTSCWYGWPRWAAGWNGAIGNRSGIARRWIEGRSRHRLLLFPRIVLLAVLTVMFAVPTATAQNADLNRRTIEEIVHDYLLNHPEVVLEALKRLQERQGAAREQMVRETIAARADDLFRNEGTPVSGAKDGDVTLVEFYDYRCPVCRRTYPAIQKLFAADRHLRRVYKLLPILGSRLGIHRSRCTGGARTGQVPAVQRRADEVARRAKARRSLGARRTSRHRPGAARKRYEGRCSGPGAPAELRSRQGARNPRHTILRHWKRARPGGQDGIGAGLDRRQCPRKFRQEPMKPTSLRSTCRKQNYATPSLFAAFVECGMWRQLAQE